MNEISLEVLMHRARPRFLPATREWSWTTVDENATAPSPADGQLPEVFGPYLMGENEGSWTGCRTYATDAEARAALKAAVDRMTDEAKLRG